MKELIKQFFYLIDTQAKKAIPFIIVAFLLSSLLDVVGIGLVGLFLGLLATPDLLTHKFAFLSTFTEHVSEKRLIVLSGIFIVCAFASKAVITLLIQTKLVYFCQEISIRLRARLMAAYQYAPYTYHLERNSAHLISRIQINLGSYINNVLLAAFSLVSSAIITACILLFLVILHPYSTCFLILMFTLVGLGYDLLAKQKLSQMGKISAELGGEITKNIHQGLQGLTEIRVFGREKYFLNSLNTVSQEYARANGLLIALQMIPRYLVENIIAIFVVGLSVMGIAAGFDKGSVVAMVGMFAAAGARLLPTVNQIITTISQIRGSYSNLNLIYSELLELDLAAKKSANRKLFSETNEKLNFSTICLNNISYFYPHANHTALENINIEIRRGQSIGLIGASGAGKSTLVNVILGFLNPEQGQLLVDGKTIQNLRAWLNNFAYIPQTIFLLDDSLKRNIAFGVNESDIDEERVWNALQCAQLTDVVNHLPDGLDTLIGENGIRLSGGQRQRVALARAFYHERDIIIMDEATSSLDNETEKEVISTIKRLKGNKTLIVIAHRLTTVEHCDVLYRLDKGQIAAVGSFQEVVG